MAGAGGVACHLWAPQPLKTLPLWKQRRKHSPARLLLALMRPTALSKPTVGTAILVKPYIDVVRRFEDQGVAAVVYTDIGRDGALQGVNVEATAALAEATAIPVVASGGVASVADVSALRDASAPIEGVIIGRALYDGRISADEALAAATGAERAG